MSAVIAALFSVFPELRPDPRERAEAAIAVLAVDENVTQGEYFARPGAPSRPGCNAERLRRRGTVFYISVDASGFKRSSVRLRWFTYEAGNLQRRKGGPSSGAPETIVFKPSAPINRQIAEVWVPRAPAAGDWYVRFELYEGQEVLRAFVDSPLFSTPPAVPGSYHGPWCRFGER